MAVVSENTATDSAKATTRSVAWSARVEPRPGCGERPDGPDGIRGAREEERVDRRIDARSGIVARTNGTPTRGGRAGEDRRGRTRARTIAARSSRGP